MIEPAYRTHRYVLRPDFEWSDVDQLAAEWGWRLVYDSPRDREAGEDGRMIWQSLPDVSLHYTVDSISGIGYVTIAGSGGPQVSPYVEQMVKALHPWGLQDLIEEFDAQSDSVKRGKLAMQIGLAASGNYDSGVFQRLRSLLGDSDARTRYIGLWSAAFTEYRDLVPEIRKVASTDSEEWVRERATAIVEALTDGEDS